ncbi:lysozyme [Falsirhodobacter sp. 1013]|uniref:lysozyme n=1 Tax=Falsirhodobacter sp. 1013 TaxID=3417566 RepID=UPI003EB9B902
MQVSDRGLVALMQHEGIVPAPYADSVGILTYGIGHTAAAGDPDPATLPMGMPADLDAALAEVAAVFRGDIARYTADVPKAVKVPLAPHELDALASFHYNTGAIARAGTDEGAERSQPGTGGGPVPQLEEACRDHPPPDSGARPVPPRHLSRRAGHRLAGVQRWPDQSGRPPALCRRPRHWRWWRLSTSLSTPR